jgi:hypothetical protein
MLTQTKRRRAVLGVVAVIWVMLTPGTAQAGGAGRATLIIHARHCPVGGPTRDIFAECHGTPVPAEWGVTFRVHHRTPQAPDARGNVVFRHLASGDHLLVQASGPTPSSVRVRLWCRVPGSGVPWRELRSHVVRLQGGVRTVCDWYFIPLGE